MPNWCDNKISVKHENPEMIQRFDKAFKEGRLLEEFVPFPNGTWDYDWCVENWGTKWDINGGEFQIDENDPTSGSGYFDSAWAPPVEAMDKMTELGFVIELYYYEGGVGYVGKYTSEEGDRPYELDFSDPEWRENLSEDIIEEFVLEEEYQNWLEWNKESEDEP